MGPEVAGRRPVRLLGASVSNLTRTLNPVLAREARLPFDET
jgi:hypothetical protein